MKLRYLVLFILSLTILSNTGCVLKNNGKILTQAIEKYDAKEYDQALKLFQTIDTDAEAQCYIGKMYERGKG